MAAGHPLSTFLQRQRFVVLDGGLATELERQGADLSDPLWSARLLIDSPESIRRVHLDYLDAGADVLTTASYQATFAGFARSGVARTDAAVLLRRSVELAIEARDAFWSEPSNRVGRIRPLVAASIGPYGAFLADGSEYRGDYGLGRTALKTFHRDRLELLAGTEADLLACETIPCKIEGEALVELLAEHPGPAAWLSFSCRDGARVRHGEPFAECVGLAAGCDRIFACGLNCTSPSHVEPLLRSAARAFPGPLVAYPNSGERWDATGRRWKEGAPGPPELPVLRWHAAGARLIGGCCRTTPDDIRRIRVALQG